ncbi:acetylornithine deacetylase succinyl-diaminopimelate desuccinylase-like protein [Ligilactobacillus murinus DSM 20452 = NBRC 14221]|uniref:Acetylornithine deacetylase succinyl-diaminopimelate desuccinylase-like protein n=1 Tax=Ligilactobacillus murinus DSM 20452 = NBRC 14221 TaxID=1423772 RepID=A0A0R2BCL3_9LACO|nr:M20/M25/M40 family metallo-hydrolase [Ligilactobacillus murinus]KRM74315.1 acetylornithine deacetylase succinyl-diaminopimelate desuccinylase-like protein [Ligilactobacillus murinus DSM 20452 = NBRC 14221]MCR1891073.1 M20/M25/M40 family metallo-hydrolase [Ligilactobacillus murinus]
MEIEEYALKHLADHFDYLRIKTIAAQDSGIKQTSDWLVDTFKALGATKTKTWTEHGGNPVIFAEFDAGKEKTVLFYNHYDTQPAEPLERWTSDPFEPVIREDKLFARGVSDDKGELIARLIVVKYFLQKGELPVNVKFIVEGEEEIGSAHLAKCVATHQKELTADVCFWEGGGKNEAEKYQIVGGVRGIVALEIEVETADYDLHSSLASYAESAAWRLVQGLASLRDTKGNILVADLKTDADELTKTEKKAIVKSPFDKCAVKKASGLKRPFLTKDPKKELVNGITLTINGITTGYQEVGVKTVLPRYAVAKLDCRLTPSQDPRRVAKVIAQQLRKNGFEDLKVKYIVGQKGFRTDITSPFVSKAYQVAKRRYGEDNVCYLPNASGAGPAYVFGDDLGIPVISGGIGYAQSNEHGADENIRLVDFEQFTGYLKELLEEIGK